MLIFLCTGVTRGQYKLTSCQHRADHLSENGLNLLSSSACHIKMAKKLKIKRRYKHKQMYIIAFFSPLLNSVHNYYLNRKKGRKLTNVLPKRFYSSVLQILRL